MVILGIDPGLASLGFGLVDAQKGRIVYLDHGIIRTEAQQDESQRLLIIYQAMKDMINHYKPQGCGMETLYFAKNVTSGLPVAQARGVTLLALAEAGITVGEYSPKLIKQSVVGYGQADKNQVKEMVRLILGLNQLAGESHGADALAAAICHCHHARGGFQ